jgi:hypothetical protein
MLSGVFGSNLLLIAACIEYHVCAQFREHRTISQVQKVSMVRPKRFGVLCIRPTTTCIVPNEFVLKLCSSYVKNKKITIGGCLQ